jgi:hypothetical protein
VTAASPLQIANSPGVHITAMHVPGIPPIAPSISQYGNDGSTHVPSPQYAGFLFVHAPTSPRQPRTITHFMLCSFKRPLPARLLWIAASLDRASRLTAYHTSLRGRMIDIPL